MAFIETFVLRAAPASAHLPQLSRTSAAPQNRGQWPMGGVNYHYLLGWRWPTVRMRWHALTVATTTGVPHSPARALHPGSQSETGDSALFPNRAISSAMAPAECG
jgi:hypothetical protein